jgi:uncharacterized protein YkwD
MKAIWAAGFCVGIGVWGAAHQARSAGSHEAGVVLKSLDSWAARAESSVAVVAHNAERQGSHLAHDLPGFLQAGPPTSNQIAQAERDLCARANRERVKRGLPALKISPGLALVARGHSLEMAQKGFFSHSSPTSRLRTPLLRYQMRFKKPPRLVAENIYKLETSGFYALGPADFARAHTGWMLSPGHRANILRSSPAGGPTHIGVGIVVRNGSFWATQNFARSQ